MSVDPIRIVRRAAAACVNAQAVEAQKRSRDAAPRDTGGLAESIEVARGTVNFPSASIYTDLEYAAYQHEQMDLQHPGGGGPKFMEAPLLSGEGRAALADKGAEAARKILGG